ncbi:MAG TPA: hypothetical protein VNL14_16685 [Candidatus Acidoferrales bacterium]|nr:hypothetical protein [Candidatus Acidoferrales bacterium]
MPRTEITVKDVGERYPVLPLVANAHDFSFTVGDAVNGMAFKATGREVVIFNNINAAAQNAKIVSVVDAFNRTGDLGNYSLGANEFAVFAPPLAGFQQSDGMIYIDVGHADVKVAVLKLPSMV